MWSWRRAKYRTMLPFWILQFSIQSKIIQVVLRRWNKGLLFWVIKILRKKFCGERSPPVSRSSVKFILRICASFGFKLLSRDVKQAFIQSKFPLDRPLYIKPPLNPDLMRMINQPTAMYLHALKPIYGLTESPVYWWQTFNLCHIDDLRKTQ